MEKLIGIDCKYCEETFSTPLEWARENGRVFCPSCCKSFDVKISEETRADYSSLIEKMRKRAEEEEKKEDKPEDKASDDGMPPAIEDDALNEEDTPILEDDYMTYFSKSYGNKLSEL